LIPYYYSIVALGVVYVLVRSGINRLSLFVVLIFWEGLFGFLGVINIYKIMVFAYALVILSQNKWTQSYKDKYINLFFLLFSIFFWISYLLYGGNLITILSQYGFKYGMVFLIYHGFKEFFSSAQRREYFKRLLLRVLTIQIILSVIKIIIIGFPVETNVGSITYGAGGTAVVIPIIGLIFYWVINNNGNFRIKNWLYVSSLLIVAIASGKRSPMILFPLCIAILFISGHEKFKISRVIKYLPIAITLSFILFYFGLRLLPSLNPDQKVWGRFDPQYTLDYVLIYNFGTDELGKIEQAEEGRGASLFLLFKPNELNLKNIIEILFGKGIYKTATKSSGRFLGGRAYGIDHQGLLGTFIYVIYSLGYAGFLSMLCFSLALLNSIKQNNIKYILIGFYVYEFFLYANQVVFSNASAVLVVFVCHYCGMFVNSSPDFKFDKVKIEPHENIVYPPCNS